MSKSKTVLITGASSGIGYALGKIFAKNSYNLILIAKNKEKLLQAAQSLKNDNISLWTIAKDLSDSRAPDEIYKEVTSQGISVDVLVNNAGFATYGFFTETNLQEELNELQVNIVTLTHMTKLFASDMVKRKNGKILNVASTAAFLPGPLMAVYYASKAYVLSFSEALVEELKGTGVHISVLCPGPTNTGFVKRAHMQNSRLFHGDNMNASEVAHIAYRGLMENKTLVIPGIRNKLMVEAIRFVPRSILARIFKKMQGKL